jgi:tight adherence protein C
MGFDEALTRMYLNGGHRARPLFDELQHANRLIQLGSSRSEALRAVAEPLRIESLETVVACIAQGEIMGIGMAQSLRAQAEMVRNQIYEDAMARAHRLPVELLFPLALGILPSLFLMVIGPPLLQLLQFFNEFPTFPV